MARRNVSACCCIIVCLFVCAQSVRVSSWHPLPFHIHFIHLQPTPPYFQQAATIVLES